MVSKLVCLCVVWTMVVALTAGSSYFAFTHGRAASQRTPDERILSERLAELCRAANEMTVSDDESISKKSQDIGILCRSLARHQRRMDRDYRRKRFDSFPLA